MDITGQVYGRLTVIRSVAPNGYKKLWECQCECGTVRIFRQDHIRAGASRSCGCLGSDVTASRNFRHGEAAAETKTPEYRSWAAAINRCCNPKNAAYADYGGRGIYVCSRWRQSFQAFLEDMGRRPDITFSLDRFPDNDGPYSPENCRWATPHEQRVNSRPKSKSKTRIKNELEQAA